MRIAISPLSELIGALELLHRHGVARVPWPYTVWAQQAGAVLHSMPASAPLWIYGRLLDLRHRQRTPDVFHPLAASPAPRIEDELDLLCRTPQSAVDAQFTAHCPTGAPGWLATFQHDPARSFAALADSLSAFWQRAMRPFWPRMRAALDEELLLRGRAIATIGPESILSDLRGATRWEQPVLSLPKTRESRMNTAGQRLLLVPTLFADQQVTCSTDHPAVLRLTYQCRGAAVLAPATQRATATGADRLGTLIGERRALIMRALTTPATTSGLATVLGLPASTVSEQLAALHAAGVLHRRRAGRQVFYGLEPTGHALLAMFDPPTIDPAPANRFTS